MFCIFSDSQSGFLSSYRFRFVRTFKISVCSVCSQTANLALCQVIDSGLYEPLKFLYVCMFCMFSDSQSGFLSSYRFRSVRTFKISVCSVCSQTANLALCQVIDSGLYEPLKFLYVLYVLRQPIWRCVRL